MNKFNVKATNVFMQEAIDEACIGIINKHGGPFGTVIVKDGLVVGRGHNVVLKANDPTAHGEISAIRDACANLNTYDLDGCILYTTGEPCPMCLFACKWANIKKVYYGCNIEDNSIIGFRDEEFDSHVSREDFSAFLECVDRDACIALFEVYRNMDHEIY